jgi:hypothetical protein
MNRPTPRRASRILPVAVGLSLLLPGAAGAYSIMHAPSGTELHWPAASLPVSFQLHAGGTADVTDGSDLLALAAAFDTWQDVACTSIEFVRADDLSSAAQSCGDGINAVFFEESSWPADYGSEALGVTSPCFDPNTGEIFDADIVFNGVDYKWATDGRKNAVDVQNIATHEAGHFIGIGHSEYADATMYYASGGNGETFRRDLTTDDEAAVCHLYPTDCLTDEDCAEGDLCIRYRCQPEPPPPAGLGEPCGDSLSCVEGTGYESAFCIASWPDGYCVHEECDADTPCPAGGYCVPMQFVDGDGNVFTVHTCLAFCDPQQPGCRDEYMCRPDDDDDRAGFCYPKCQSDAQCDPYACDEISGYCMMPGNDDADIGDPCAQHDDCPTGGRCIGWWPNGYCTRTCGAGMPCPDGSTCYTVDGNSQCLADCPAKSTDVCRENYACWPMGASPSAGACRPACTSDFQCQLESGANIVCNQTTGLCEPVRATRLVVVTEPPASITAGETFTVVVEAHDDAGNRDLGHAFDIVLAVDDGPGGTLGGTLVRAPVDGVAIFDDLWIDMAGEGYVLEATSEALTRALTESFTVTAGAATGLVVTTEPPLSIGAGLEFAVTVDAVDDYGNLDPTFVETVAVALSTGPAGSTLGGTTSLSATGGRATFPDLWLDTTGEGYSLAASATGVDPAVTRTFEVVPGPPATLEVLDAPGESVVAGETFAVVIEVQDAFGHPVTDHADALTLGISTGPGSLVGVTEVMPVDGVATFAGLSIEVAGDYLLEVTTGALAADVGPFAVVAAAAERLSVAEEPAYAILAEPFRVLLRVEDSFGNRVTGFDDSVTVALGANPAGGNLSGTASLAAVAGIADFDDLVIDTAGTGYTVEATSAGLQSAETAAFDVLAVAPTDIAVIAQPPATVTAGASFTVVFEILDENADRVVAFNAPVTIGLSAGPDGGSLGGTRTVNAIEGVVTFDDLWLDRAGEGYRLVATSGSLASAPTEPVAVTAAAATRIVVVTEPPATVTAGAAFTIAVEAHDPYGNTDLAFIGSIGLALVSGPDGASLGGEVAREASAGVVVFDDLWVDRAGAGYVLEATGYGLAPATTRAFSVSPAAAVALHVVADPPASVAAGQIFAVTVEARDGHDNLDTSFAGDVSLSLVAGTEGASLGGTATLAAAGGVVTFDDLFIDRVGEGYVLEATADGLDAAVTTELSITPAAAVSLEVTTSPPASVAAGEVFTVTVSSRDAHGNLDTGHAGEITLSLVAGPGAASLGGQVTRNAEGGVATFGNLWVELAGTGYVIEAASESLGSDTTTAFTVTPGDAVALAVTTQPPASMGVGDFFTVAVAARDDYGNTDAGYTADVSVQLAANPGDANLVGVVTRAASSGTVVFDGLALDAAGDGFVLEAISGALMPATFRTFNVSADDPGGEDPGGEDPGGEDPGGEDPGGEDPGGEDPGGEDPGADPEDTDPGGCGCAAAGSSSGTGATFLLLGLVLALRRRGRCRAAEVTAS